MGRGAAGAMQVVAQSFGILCRWLQILCSGCATHCSVCILVHAARRRCAQAQLHNFKQTKTTQQLDSRSRSRSSFFAPGSLPAAQCRLFREG